MAATSAKPRRVIDLSGFLGVDFTSAETEVDRRRSPESVNMTAGKSGRPELREGYSSAIELGYGEEELSAYLGEVKGIHFHNDTMIVHTGSCYAAFDLYEDSGLYRYSGKYFILPPLGGRSTSFFMNLTTYLLDGAKYVEFSGEEGFSEVEGFIPTTSIARSPSGGGSVLEAVNKLTRKRKNSFTADGTSTIYTLDAKVDTAYPVIATISGVQQSVSVEGDKVTFSSPPPADDGIDSVVITFSATGAGSRADIEGCTICSTFGAGNPNRVFLSGNEDKPNMDWYSGLYSPDYFSDTSYTMIGSEDSAIMGYLKQYGRQIVVKEDKDKRSGLYLREAQISEGVTADGASTSTFTFSLSEGVQGIGAAAKGSAVTVNGYPLFLSNSGLMYPQTNAITNQQSLKNVSVHVNKRLLAEDLSKARLVAAKDKLVIAVQDRMYVAFTDKMGEDGFEWFYWEDMPAGALASHDGRLYFSDSGFLVYRQNSVAEMGMSAYSDNGRAISASWWSPVFDGEHPMQEKSINLRGTGVVFKPNFRTSAKLYIRTNKHKAEQLGEYFGDIFTFADVDFNRFSFNTNDISQVGISSKRMRNVQSFQIGVIHENNNDFLGLLGMSIDYTVAKKIKRRI